MTRYVLGFMFDDKGERVVLIRLENPSDLPPRWNGVYGKIEHGETSAHAITRAFQEGTTVFTAPTEWQLFAVMKGASYEVDVYRCFSNTGLHCAQTCTTESVCRANVGEEGLFNPDVCVSNLSWMIPMALDRNDGGHPFVAEVTYIDPDASAGQNSEPIPEAA